MIWIVTPWHPDVFTIYIYLYFCHYNLYIFWFLKLFSLCAQSSSRLLGWRGGCVVPLGNNSSSVIFLDPHFSLIFHIYYVSEITGFLCLKNKTKQNILSAQRVFWNFPYLNKGFKDCTVVKLVILAVNKTDLTWHKPGTSLVYVWLCISKQRRWPFH